MKKLAVLLALLLLMGNCFAATELHANYDLLEKAGIPVPDAVRAEIEAQAEEIKAHYPELFRQEFGEIQMDVRDVLCMLGMGKLDVESWRYIPYTDEVYAFDAEMYDVEGSYLDLLDAIDRMGGDAVQISDCRVELSEELFMAGSDTLPIHYRLNGTPCSYEAKFEYDWMDCRILDQLNADLKRAGVEARIWSCYDGGQGLILLLREKAWAQDFSHTTGLELSLGSGESAEQSAVSGLLDWMLGKMF